MSHQGPCSPQMAVSLGTYYGDCLECKEVEAEGTFLEHVTAHCI